MTRQDLYSLLDNSIPLPNQSPLQVLNKDYSIKLYTSYMLDRTNSMFTYSGLPDTIPASILELYLQIFGFCAFTEIPKDHIARASLLSPATAINPDNRYFIFYGSLGGERDIYYRPTLFIVANPRLKNSFETNVVYSPINVDIKAPSIIIRNDTNYVGLLPLFTRYAAQLTENDISIRSAQINARAQIGISVSTDRDKEAARKYLDDLESGKLGILAETAFLEGVTVSNVGTQSSNHIIQLIELQQYLKASWYNELGLNVNFNMKREYMSEEEIAVNTDILLPLVDDMLKCRKEAIDLINQTFDLSISVEKASAWANKEQEELAALGEQSQAGGVPFSDTINARLSETHGDTSIQANTYESVQDQTQQPAESNDSTVTRATAESIPESTVQPATVSEQPITINIDSESETLTINVNSNDSISEDTENVSESETPQESSQSND